MKNYKHSKHNISPKQKEIKILKNFRVLFYLSYSALKPAHFGMNLG